MGNQGLVLWVVAGERCECERGIGLAADQLEPYCLWQVVLACDGLHGMQHRDEGLHGVGAHDGLLIARMLRG